MIRDGQLSARQMVVVTDHVIHRFWYAEHVDHWFLSSELGLETLQRWLIDPQGITVSGMPVHPKWTQPLDRERIYAEWYLPRHRKIVLLTGGTEFVCGPVVKVARGVLEACGDACVVLLAGRNKKLLAELSSLGREPDRLIAVAFTDRVHELVEVCSLMITKAGGSTTAECLAKGTPMVLLKSVPGQEAGNAAYLQREGAAVTTRKTSEVVAQTRRLLNDPAALAQLAQNARRLYRPATQTIVDAIVKAVQPGTA